VSPVYVYALLDGRPSGPLPAGIGGERLRLLEAAGIVAVIGDVPAAPAVEVPALRAHDATARAVADGAAAALPARFGAVLEDEAALAQFLEVHRERLREALDLVRGCRQMTLRVSSAPGAAAPRPESPRPDPATGPGTAYLRARAAREARNDPRVRAVIGPLEGLVRATRVDGHEHPPLIASVYHLVPVDRVAEYEAGVALLVSAHPEIRISSSGPWLPYAFAPESLV